MANKPKIGLREAYALQTPADSVELYGNWAESYDEDFIAAKGYVAFRHAAEFYLQHPGRQAGVVLDVGCGTGVVGEVLRAGGASEVHGIDISTAMLEQAQQKTTPDGSAVYAKLLQADLTRTLAIDDNRYLGIVSAGTFTHGHLGPAALGELWRIAAPGAVCSIGVNAGHFDSHGFAERFADDVAAGVIAEPDIHLVDSYTKTLDNIEKASTQTMFVVCQVL